MTSRMAWQEIGVTTKMPKLHNRRESRETPRIWIHLRKTFSSSSSKDKNSISFNKSDFVPLTLFKCNFFRLPAWILNMMLSKVSLSPPPAHILRYRLHMTKNLLTNIRRIFVDEEFIILNLNFLRNFTFWLNFDLLVGFRKFYILKNSWMKEKFFVEYSSNNRWQILRHVWMGPYFWRNILKIRPFPRCINKEFIS